VDMRAIGRRETWKGLSLERRSQLWRATGRHSGEQLPLSWELPTDLRMRASLRWPRTYDWAHAGQWLSSLREGFATHLQVEDSEIEQPFERVLVAQLDVNGRAHRIAVDYSDSPDVSQEAVASAELYFKMQHRAEGYGLENVLPGGFVPNSERLYSYLALVRRARDARQFELDAYGSFSAGYASEVRRQAIGALTAQQQFNFGGGWNVVRYSGFLDRVAHSKVCIDLPGNGPFCFRLIDYLAVGSCIVGPPHGTVLHVPLVDGEHVTYTDPSLANLVEVTAELVADESRRERLASNARDFFDRFLDARQLTAYYLAKSLEACA
jgi:hypothetical protein